MKYTKPPTEIQEQISLLEQRGLRIDDKSQAERYLATVGYFRLTGYMYHLQEVGTHKFIEGTSSNDILLHYKFDKELRSLLLEYLERIEVALRARLTNTYSLSHGFYWYTNKSLYADYDVYEIIMAEITSVFEEPQDSFLKSFKRNYTSEHLPPSNMAMEILSLGKICRLYRGLKNDKEKLTIAKDFNLPSSTLSSWIIYLTNVRNICAHHSRLWNRKISADRPTIPHRKEYKFQGTLPEDFNTTVYGIASLIDRLLKSISEENNFINKFTSLIEKYPVIKTDLMGLPPDWRENAAWKKTAN